MVFFSLRSRLREFFAVPLVRQENLYRDTIFFPNAAEALFAGYRPCQRCKPPASSADPNGSPELVDRVEADPECRISDADLIEGSTLLRCWPALSSALWARFQAYQRAAAAGGRLRAIKSGGSLDDAVFDYGYDRIRAFEMPSRGSSAMLRAGLSKDSGGDFII